MYCIAQSDIIFLINYHIMTDFNYEIKDLEAMSMALNYHGWVVSKFKKYLGGHVAEIGAGSGNFSKFILKSSDIKKLTSVEPDKVVCDIYKKNISDPRAEIINAFFGDVSHQYPDSFDSIVYTNVLEHVENDKSELEFVYKSLKSGGKVCIFVPALPFLYSEHDKTIGHFRRYTKERLKRILEESGFIVEKINYFDILGIITWLVMYKILKREPNPGNVGFYDKLIIPLCKILESIIPPPIGKNLLAIAQKP